MKTTTAHTHRATDQTTTNNKTDKQKHINETHATNTTTHNKNKRHTITTHNNNT